MLADSQTRGPLWPPGQTGSGQSSHFLIPAWCQGPFCFQEQKSLQHIQSRPFVPLMMIKGGAFFPATGNTDNTCTSVPVGGTQITVAGDPWLMDTAASPQGIRLASWYLGKSRPATKALNAGAYLTTPVSSRLNSAVDLRDRSTGTAGGSRPTSARRL